jgi:hypothetical protein
MFHYSQAVLALSKEPNPTVFQKTLGVNDFYFGDDEYDYPMGNIQMVGKSQAEMYKGEKPIETSSRRRSPSRTSPRTPSTSGLDRGPAAPENRVTLERTGTSAYVRTEQRESGAPVPQAQVMLGHLG